MKSSVTFKPFGIARRVLTCVGAALLVGDVLAYHPETPPTDQGHLSDDGAPDDGDVDSVLNDDPAPSEDAEAGNSPEGAGSAKDGSSRSGQVRRTTQGSSVFDVPWHTIAGGGVASDGTEDGLVLSGTMGQLGAGVMEGGSYKLVGGFQAFQSGSAPPCPADLDGSGDVSAADLAQLLGAWGACAEPCAPDDGQPNSEGTCPADFSDNCFVDAADLAQLLGSWGFCP